jgi:PAS domain-containing protein
MWCFVILFAALCLIALATLALVLFVSRRMAREEAEAAKVVLEARQTEERNGELQRLNDALRASEETLQAQNERFDAALNNMTHGMCMFDKDERLVVCNNVYLEMYGLSPELAEPGTPLRTILKARAASSAAPVDAGDYTAHVVDIVSRKDTRYGVRELRDGRFVAIAHKPMPGGGWVAVHQDVTAQKRAENAIARMARQEAGRVDVRERMDEPAPA